MRTSYSKTDNTNVNNALGKKNFRTSIDGKPIDLYILKNI